MRSFHLLHEAADSFELTVLNLAGLHGTSRLPDEFRARIRAAIDAVDFQDADSADHTRTGRLWSFCRTLRSLMLPASNRWQDFMALFLQDRALVGHADAPLRSRLVVAAADFWSGRANMPPVPSFMFYNSWRRIRTAALALDLRQFDVFWVEHVLAWPFAQELLESTPGWNPYVICSAHNVEHIVSRRQVETATDPLQKTLYRIEEQAMRRMEQSAWRRASLILQCSASDKQLTQAFAPRKPVEVIPNGVDCEYFQRSSHTAAASPGRIVFTAGFGYAPNVDAVWWFVRDVLPLVLAQLPEIRFLFAGSNAAGLMHELHAAGLAGNVEVNSDPLDIRPCFECGQVYVVPLRSGGGTRLKILEAMAMQVPVVSTTVGAEGIPYRPNEDLLIADSAEDFADAVVRLFRDSGLQQRLTTSASAFIREGWEWQSIRGRLRNILSTLP